MRKVAAALDTLEFQMLYPPEGNSSILEVSEKACGDFLHVVLNKNGDLVFEFFGQGTFSLSEMQIEEIKRIARRNIAWTDYTVSGAGSCDDV